MGYNTGLKSGSSTIALLFILLVLPCFGFSQRSEFYSTQTDSTTTIKESSEDEFTFHFYDDNICSGKALPSVSYVGMLSKLTPAAQARLKAVAGDIKDNPECRVKVTGYGSNSKKGQQLSWTRVSTVINFLVEKQGISQDRFIFESGQEGDPQSVDLQFTSEDGPEMVPPPHPQYQTTPAPTKPVTKSPKKTIVKKPVKKTHS
jgi:hypothetical protein